jgi:hypothetical protein
MLFLMLNIAVHLIRQRAISKSVRGTIVCELVFAESPVKNALKCKKAHAQTARLVALLERTSSAKYVTARIARA